MRMIAFQFDGNSAMFRYYMDSEPTDDEREMAEIVALNFDAGLPTTLSSVGVEFVVTNDPLGRLDVLDFGLYRRWEAT